ncbi:MAG: pyrroline-5-carboxylate reductase [Planctomycetaceae bacterium]|nr:pyrroline-5-carboxylate reductase [Planctomycetaceae bacterium]
MTKIGFLGAGQMATALALGFLKSGVIAKDQVFASDAVAAAGQRFAEVTGGTLCASNRELAGKVDLLFLAVKPQQMSDALREIADHADPDMLFVSIAAGLPVSFFEKRLGCQLKGNQAKGNQAKIVRVMPNTPCLVGQGVCAYSVSEATSEADRVLVKTLLETVGVAELVPEKQMDAVTGLSGSGPAYVCMMIEALSDAGVKMGLPRRTATRFAAQTLLGTAEMVLKTDEHPAVLKDRVASPGGTTIAGIHALEEHQFRAALIAAVEAATKRSVELSQ